VIDQSTHEFLGTTPLRATFPRGDGERALLLVARRFGSRQITVPLNDDADITIELQPQRVSASPRRVPQVVLDPEDERKL
jgi:hypothetical protein